MKGEELQGLKMEELEKLEQLLQEGLSRVLTAKVCLSLLSLFPDIIMEQWNFCTWVLTYKAFTCFRMKDL